jgi:hypothetical protein
MKLSALLFPIFLLAPALQAIKMPPTPQGVPFTGNPNELQIPQFAALRIIFDKFPLIPDKIDPKIIAAQLNIREINVEEKKDKIDGHLIIMRKKNKIITDDDIAKLESECRVLQMKIPEPENESSQSPDIETLINSDLKYIKLMLSQINLNISPEEFSKQTVHNLENIKKAEQQMESFEIQRLRDKIEVKKYKIEQFQKYKEETTSKTESK